MVGGDFDRNARMVRVPALTFASSDERDVIFVARRKGIFEAG